MNILDAIELSKFPNIKDFNNISTDEYFDYLKFWQDNNLFLFVYKELLKRTNSEDKERLEVLNSMKIANMISVLMQKNKMNVLFPLFKLLEEKNIEYVLLKGPICARTYPEESMRLFGDVDLLINKSNAIVVKQCLHTIGYEVNKAKGCLYEDHFEHEAGMLLELHYEIDDGEFFPNKEVLEQCLLKNRVLTTFNGTNVSIPSKHKHLVYVILHAVKHLKFYGFSIRHLLDIHYLIEDHNDIDWDRIIEDLEIQNIDGISRYLFTMCVSVFETLIPEEYLSNKDEKYDLLYDYVLNDTILNGGMEKENYVESSLARYSEEISNKKFKKYLSLLFPKTNLLTRRYRYAKRNSALLPVAWVHRFFYEILFERSRIFNVMNNEVDIEKVNSHARLLRTFDLYRK